MCVVGAGVSFSLPSLRTATFAQLVCPPECYDLLLNPTTFPQLKILAVIGYDGDRHGPTPGASTIIARMSSHYNDFPPPPAPGDATRAAPMLWRLNHFEAAHDLGQTVERWHASDLPVHYVQCEAPPSRGAPAPSPAFALLRLREDGHPLLRELKVVYVSNEAAIPEMHKEKLIELAAAAKVKLVLEERRADGCTSWFPPQFLAMCEKLAKAREEEELR